MSTVAATLELEGLLTARAPLSYVIASTPLARANLPQASASLINQAADTIAVAFATGMPPPPPYGEATTQEVEFIGNHWYEFMHILPRSLEFGNVLSAAQEVIEIFNAYRTQQQSVTGFTNNAGEGTEIIDLPSLPYVMPPLSSLFLTLELQSQGAPTVDTDLVFETSLTYDLTIPITATRLVVFPFAPEAPIEETLRFLTDVIQKKDGTEQRVALRRSPRQEFLLTFKLEEGYDLSRFDVLLYEWQARVFGVPVWAEPTFLTADAAMGDFTINVESTANADYRVGSLAVVWYNDTTFDALEVDSLTSTTITFRSPLTQDFVRGAAVMPMRTATAEQTIKGQRYPRNAAVRELRFKVQNNLVPDDFPSLGDYAQSGGPLDGEIVIDDLPLGVSGSLRETHEHRLYVFDSETGVFTQDSPWAHNLRGYPFEITVTDRPSLWAVRRLLHALRGRQAGFFLPTFYHDLEATQPWPNGTSTIVVRNVGFTRFAQQRGRYRYLRIRMTDGTVIDAEIQSSAEVSAHEEQLGLSATAGQTYAPEDFAQIQFLEKVRIDKDDIQITHLDALGQARIFFPVRSLMS